MRQTSNHSIVLPISTSVHPQLNNNDNNAKGRRMKIKKEKVSTLYGKNTRQ